MLVQPREELEVEIKGWLNLQSSNEDKATLAKALLALANHGGGYVIIGFSEVNASFQAAQGRPATLEHYRQDIVNGIVQKYAEPAFHCTVHLTSDPDGNVYPIISAPGGHKVPISAKRAGPNNETIQQHAIYIRRGGPASEIPQSAQDWDQLLTRCLDARRDELLNRIRDILSGTIGRPSEDASEAKRLHNWMDTCSSRWKSLTDGLPAGDPRKFPKGYQTFAYAVDGEIRQLCEQDFVEILRSSVVRHTGWPLWHLPASNDVKPYIFDDAVECWHGRDNGPFYGDPAHLDFWRISKTGLVFLMRGYEEDGLVADRRIISAGTVLDVGLPIWRLGEALLHAERLATNLCDGPTSILFRARYVGLQDRELISIDRRRDIGPGRICRQDNKELVVEADGRLISTQLPELLHALLSPLYALFDFFPLSRSLVNAEVEALRSHHF